MNILTCTLTLTLLQQTFTRAEALRGGDRFCSFEAVKSVETVAAVAAVPSRAGGSP